MTQRLELFTGTRRETKDGKHQVTWLERDTTKIPAQYGGITVSTPFDWGNQRPNSDGVQVLAFTLLAAVCGLDAARRHSQRMAKIAAFEFDRWGFTVTSDELRRLVAEWEAATCEGK